MIIDKKRLMIWEAIVFIFGLSGVVGININKPIGIIFVIASLVVTGLLMLALTIAVGIDTHLEQKVK